MNQSLRLRQTIETEIVDGRLAIGARLDETELAERFGVSRTPIREALLQLAMTGLVEIKPRRGALVSAPDPQLLIAMFETMAEIEAACGRLAARRLIPADEAALKAALAACAAAAEAQDPERYYDENYVFHTVVYQACRNGFLAEQARLLHRRLAPFRRMQLRARHRLGQSLAEHEAIVAAIVAGDETGAAERLRAHVIVQGDRFSDLVASLRAINDAA
ncbi:AsnC family transcriptional regulator [Methylobacterium sp. Leaf469]|uniref:GntR family transcriptional regulator n=1 Tax=unclassified Methylobacterium TaxID=2615210 RepID=UPI0006FC6479|nr:MULTISPECIES: GntR family transcriptional regulator [unclassified Methylobacterium]USU33579.1 GntR family transcriptional regulator [Methylobacterium sp. OTU13CASTA1]KQO69734.1 AsnC family transcriptional regulator [Methylobacterium sp. Leaf87]KQP34732.1 AsnC family transcriptional regulator [Methylobacterium sp. Leaf102]KQP36982.1 AsnC family transcriptional regulator [Methylobacterium sp. Leaf100]KQP72407.1 AsnC family transcriptional regulator [Methylobacterium sp. Leaf112]